MTNAPLSADQAKAKLNHCLEEGVVIWSQHFREELANDELDVDDVIRVCRSGAVKVAPELDIRTRQWKYQIEGLAQGNRLVLVVFTFRLNGAVFITVFEKKS